MTKFPKEDIGEVYQTEIHPKYMSLFDNPEDYENEIAEYDDYEPDDYVDDVALDDVVYVEENKELEITNEDLTEDVIKRQMREILQANYPKASLDEIFYWMRLLRQKYGISIVPNDVFTREIWLDNFKKSNIITKSNNVVKGC